MTDFDPYAYDNSMLNMSQGDPMTMMMLQMLMGGQGFEDLNAPAFNPAQLQSMVGMVPDYQPSGKPLTVSNQTSALNAYSNLLFDPAMMAFGGSDPYAPDAFAPTATTEVVQSPELRTIYGYLRDPMSVEGMIATELMEGGTPLGAIGKIRQFLAKETEDPGELELKNRLVMELPPTLDINNQPMEITPDGKGVNWLQAQDIARSIGEEYAGVPSIGPTGPQYDPETGAMVSQGGELSWSTDETGAPVMVRTQQNVSPLAEKFHELGLSSPDEEYTAESFMTPEQIDLQGQFSAMEGPVAEAMQRWQDAQGVYQQAVRDGINRPEILPQAAVQTQPEVPEIPQDYGNASLIDLMTENPTGDTSGFWNSAWRQGLWDVLSGNEGEGQPGGGPGFDLGAAAETTGTLGGNLVADAMLQNPSGDTSGVVDSLWRQGLWDIITGNEGGGDQAAPYASLGQLGGGGPAFDMLLARGNGQPPGPLDDFGGGEFPVNLTPGGYLAAGNQRPGPPQGLAPGNVLSGAGMGGYVNQLPPYARPGATPSISAPDMLQLQAQAQQMGPPAPAGPTPNPYVGGMSGSPFGVGLPPPNPVGPPQQPAYNPLSQNLPIPNPYVGSLSGNPFGAGMPSPNQQLPPYAQPGAQPARAPGGPAYIEEMETGERRRDEQAEQDEIDRQRASVLSSGDRTGKRRRNTATGEQARNKYQAFRDWDLLTDQQMALKQQAHTYDTGYAMGMARSLRQQGVTPLQQQLMARRLVLMGQGMPSSGYMPGT